MALRREQVEQWYTAGLEGNRGIVAWVADPANASDPMFPVLSQIAAAVSQGTQWLQWITLRLQLAEVQARGQAVTREAAAITAKLAALPDPTAP